MRNPETADISRVDWRGRLFLWVGKRLGFTIPGMVLCQRDTRQVVAVLVARDGDSLVAGAQHVARSVRTVETLILLETTRWREEEEEEEEETPRVVH